MAYTMNSEARKRATEQLTGHRELERPVSPVVHYTELAAEADRQHQLTRAGVQEARRQNRRVMVQLNDLSREYHDVWGDAR